jgi:CO dehydrogenase maturation factor
MNDKQSDHQPSVIAVCGKGGVGKTSVSAAIVRMLLARPGKRVLAVDADPAIGLAFALGVTVRTTVDAIRNELIDTIGKTRSTTKQELLTNLDYKIFEALCESDRLAFLAIGRPEKEGCYCQVNSLLKELIKTLSTNFDYVVIDGEAGIEQVNRRVMEGVTHLIMVSDGSVKGLHAASTIQDIASRAIRFEKSALVLNRIRMEDEVTRLAIPANLTLVGTLQEDAAIRDADMQGLSLLDLVDVAFFSNVKECLARIGI